MYEHLSTQENYSTYTVTLLDVYYYNKDTKEYIRDFSSDDFLNNDVTIIFIMMYY